MKKKCTNPACRRVFSTAGGNAACPHCGKVYRINQNALYNMKHAQPAVRGRDMGRVEIRMQGGMQHIWIGPVKRAGDVRPDHGRCGCVLRIAQQSETELKLKRIKVLYGGDAFVGLRECKDAVEAMLAAPTVLHTDAVTARNMLDSGLFSLMKASRPAKQYHAKKQPAKKQCPNVACRRMFRPGRGRLVCPHCGAEVCRAGRQWPTRNCFGSLEVVAAGSVTYVWRRDLFPDRTEMNFLVQLNRLQENRADSLLRWALGELLHRYQLDDLWETRRIPSECMPVYDLVRRLQRGPMLLRTNLDTAREIVKSGLFPIRRVARSR